MKSSVSSLENLSGARWSIRGLRTAAGSPRRPHLGGWPWRSGLRRRHDLQNDGTLELLHGVAGNVVCADGLRTRAHPIEDDELVEPQRGHLQQRKPSVREGSVWGVGEIVLSHGSTVLCPHSQEKTPDPFRPWWRTKVRERLLFVQHQGLFPR